MFPKDNLANPKGVSELKSPNKNNQSELKGISKRSVKTVDKSIKVEEMTSFRAL